jgi:glucose-1-phosphate thymidylyltransferase
MKIIIPMAGRGSRLRPHTLTTPKPLLPIAGKAIVRRIVEDLAAGMDEKVEEVAFIIGDFGKAVEEQLQQIVQAIGARCAIYYQEQPLGPGHAVLCAAPSLEGHCLVAFADTLFNADFHFDPHEDGIIWVSKVENPSSFGVVTLGDDNFITAFVEKPTTFVSDLAIVGIYYFREGERLRQTLQHIVEHDIRDKGEYQLTTALDLLRADGLRFRSAPIQEWLDCGNKNNVLATSRRLLELKQSREILIAPDITLDNAIVVPPCFIGPGAVIRNSVVGPYVCIGNNSIVEHTVISNSIIQNNTKVRRANLHFSMLGNEVEYQGEKSEISIGDYSEYKLSALKQTQ